MSKRVLAVVTLACGLVVAQAASAAVVPITLVLTGSTGHYSCAAQPSQQQVDVGDTVQFNFSANANTTGQAIQKSAAPPTNFKFQNPGQPAQNEFHGPGGGSAATPHVVGAPHDVWSYDVNFFAGAQPTGTPLCHIDPQICIKDATGSCTIMGHPGPHPTPEPKPTAKPPHR